TSFAAMFVLQSAIGGVAGAAFLGIANAAVGAALTGGIESPFVVLFLSVPASAIVSLGRSPKTLFILVATAVLVGLVALMPEAWSGPRLPRAQATIVILVMVAIGLVVLVRSVLDAADANLRAHEQIDRLREEMVKHFCERARGVQSIGAKVAHGLKNP